MDWGSVFIDGVLATIGPVTAAYAISAIGLNLQFGYAGLLNFGHVAFMLVGAYGMAITVDLGGPLWLGIPVGIREVDGELVATVVGSGIMADNLSDDVGLVLFQNAFATPIVKDQSDRGQVLIDSGLYGVVRHPFYLGILLFFLGLALWLESYASAAALLLPLATLIARITVEEKTLREMLEGYEEYTKRVRFRLVPFVW